MTEESGQEMFVSASETEANEIDGTRYRITLVPIEELKFIQGPKERMGAQAPRYDRERDEPAFEAAWKHVAEMRAQGKLTPIPPIPPGGLRVPRPRHTRLAEAEQADVED